jgi:hypothetical protein
MIESQKSNKQWNQRNKEMKINQKKYLRSRKRRKSFPNLKQRWKPPKQSQKKGQHKKRNLGRKNLNISLNPNKLLKNNRLRSKK